MRHMRHIRHRPYLEHYMNTKMKSLATEIDLGAKLA